MAWPQNKVLAGSSKNRVSYNNLTIFQWISSFSAIIKEETNVKNKDLMLEYLCDIMDDAQDFGWASAKGAHAVLLCRMEESKVSWAQTEKNDRIRRSHAQKVTQSQTQFGKKQNSENSQPCKFYQNNTCSQKSGQTTGGHTYRHICAICAGYGKRFNHPSMECRSLKKPTYKTAKNEIGTA